jgi:hypothetical protein
MKYVSIVACAVSVSILTQTSEVGDRRKPARYPIPTPRTQHVSNQISLVPFLWELSIFIYEYNLISYVILT